MKPDTDTLPDTKDELASANQYTYDHGEMGLARYFVAEHIDKIQYNHTQKQWYIWNCDGNIWEPDYESKIINFFYDNMKGKIDLAINEMLNIPKRNNRQDYQLSKLYTFNKLLMTLRTVKNVLALASSQPSISVTSKK